MGAACSNVDKGEAPARRSSFSVLNKRTRESILKPGSQYGEGYILGEAVGNDDLVVGIVNKDNDVEYVARAVEKRTMPVQHIPEIEAHLDMLQGLDHVHICTFMEAFDNGERIQLVYEKAKPLSIFEEEQDLREGKPLSQEVAQTYTRQLSMALSVAHKLGLAHGRLSDSCLLVDPAEGGIEDEGRSVKICDMGQTFMLRAPRSLSKEPNKEPCIDYEAPEMVGGDLKAPTNYDGFKNHHRSFQSLDMWALGVILHRMLTGKLPWAAKNKPAKEAILAEIVEFGKEWDTMPDAKDMVEKLLRHEGRIRLTADRVLRHPWIVLSKTKVSKSKMIRVLQNVIFNTTETTFKKFCMRVIAEDMPPEKLAIVTSAFRAIDKNCDGSLEVKEIQQCLKKYGEEEGEATQIFEAIDRNASGSLNFAEFTAVSIGPPEYCDKETLWHCFNRFDKDKNGGFDKEEISMVIREVEHLNDVQGLELQVEEIATDVDLPVDFDSFVHHMTTPAGQPVSKVRIGFDRFCNNILKVDNHGVRHIAARSYDQADRSNPLLRSPYAKNEQIAMSGSEVPKSPKSPGNRPRPESSGSKKATGGASARGDKSARRQKQEE